MSYHIYFLLCSAFVFSLNIQLPKAEIFGGENTYNESQNLSQAFLDCASKCSRNHDCVGITLFKYIENRDSPSLNSYFCNVDLNSTSASSENDSAASDDISAPTLVYKLFRNKLSKVVRRPVVVVGRTKRQAVFPVLSVLKEFQKLHNGSQDEPIEQSPPGSTESAIQIDPLLEPSSSNSSETSMPVATLQELNSSDISALQNQTFILGSPSNESFDSVFDENTFDEATSTIATSQNESEAVSTDSMPMRIPPDSTAVENLASSNSSDQHDQKAEPLVEEWGNAGENFAISPASDCEHDSGKPNSTIHMNHATAHNEVSFGNDNKTTDLCLDQQDIFTSQATLNPETHSSTEQNVSSNFDVQLTSVQEVNNTGQPGFDISTLRPDETSLEADLDSTLFEHENSNISVEAPNAQFPIETQTNTNVIHDGNSTTSPEKSTEISTQQSAFAVEPVTLGQENHTEVGTNLATQINSSSSVPAIQKNLTILGVLNIPTSADILTSSTETAADKPLDSGNTLSSNNETTTFLDKSSNSSSLSSEDLKGSSTENFTPNSSSISDHPTQEISGFSNNTEVSSTDIHNSAATSMISPQSSEETSSIESVPAEGFVNSPVNRTNENATINTTNGNENTSAIDLTTGLSGIDVLPTHSNQNSPSETPGFANSFEKSQTTTLPHENASEFPEIVHPENSTPLPVSTEHIETFNKTQTPLANASTISGSTENILQEETEVSIPSNSSAVQTDSSLLPVFPTTSNIEEVFLSNTTEEFHETNLFAEQSTFRPTETTTYSPTNNNLSTTDWAKQSLPNKSTQGSETVNPFEKVPISTAPSLEVAGLPLPQLTTLIPGTGSGRPLLDTTAGHLGIQFDGKANISVTNSVSIIRPGPPIPLPTPGSGITEEIHSSSTGKAGIVEVITTDEECLFEDRERFRRNILSGTYAIVDGEPVLLTFVEGSSCLATFSKNGHHGVFSIKTIIPEFPSTLKADAAAFIDNVLYLFDSNSGNDQSIYSFKYNPELMIYEQTNPTAQLNRTDFFSQHCGISFPSDVTVKAFAQLSPTSNSSCIIFDKTRVPLISPAATEEVKSLAKAINFLLETEFVSYAEAVFAWLDGPIKTIYVFGSNGELYSLSRNISEGNLWTAGNYDVIPYSLFPV